MQDNMTSFHQTLSKNQEQRSKLTQTASVPEPAASDQSKKKKSKISGQPHKFSRGDR
jgi:hypothetical protein